MIIGSGLTGLTIADSLQSYGFDVVVLDKGTQAGGRMAHGLFHDTNDYEYDHGAQFFTVRTSEFQEKVDLWLEKNLVKKWCNGFQNKDGHPRFIGSYGMHTVAMFLSKKLKIHQNTEIQNELIHH